MMLTEKPQFKKWITLSAVLGFAVFIFYLLFFTNFAEVGTVLGGTITSGRGPYFARMSAYAAAVDHDPALATRAWAQFFGRNPGRARFSSRRVEGPDVPEAIDEIPRISTNDTAQWCLNAIELLELVGNSLPEQQ